MRCELQVSFAGPMLTLQDGGRRGWMRYGVPGSGPMDTRALAVANAALANPAGVCGVEVSLGGLQLDCRAGSVSFAVAGGGFQVVLAGRTLAPWVVATLTQGQRLQIRPGAWGSWAMLAFAGQVQGPEWLGSRSTHSQSGLGGGVLRTGDMLTIEAAEVRPGREGDLPPWTPPRDRIRVVMGPQDRYFDANVQHDFTGTPYRLTDAYDRMGVRLSGKPLPVNAALDMPSEPVLRGTVQVAGDGVATVMLADHGTTGGYPKIATVIGPDLDDLVQHRSGDSLTFTAVTPAQAVIAAHEAQTRLTAYLTELARPRASLNERLMAGNLISGVVSGEES